MTITFEAILLLAAIILGLWHFIYEGIILPGIRLHLRNRLFALRDELRNLVIEEKNAVPDDVFKYIHNGINLYINNLHKITITFMIEIDREFEKNSGFRRKVGIRRKLIEECENEEVQLIWGNTSNIISMAFLSNMGGWFIYLVPVAVTVGAYKKIIDSLRNLFLAPSYQAESFLLHQPA